MKLAEFAELYLRKWPEDQNLPGNVFSGVVPLLQASAKQGWNKEVTRLAVATIAARDLTYTNRHADQYAFTWLATNRTAAAFQLDQILGHGKLIPKSFESLVVKAFSQELEEVRKFVRKYLQGELDGYAQ